MDDPTKESRKVWDALAPGWEKTRALIDEIEQPVTQRIHAAADVRKGDTVLELCAGPGGVGLQLAEKEPDATVLVTDFAPGMVEIARSEATSRGLRNVDCRIEDAQAIDLPDASVDAVICRFGLMLVPDMPKAFAEVRRVLRPGRPLVYTTWAPLDANPWMLVFGAAMIQRGHFKPPEGGAFMPLGSAEDNVAIARAAGFTDIEAEPIDVTYTFASDDEFWGLCSEVAGPLTLALKDLPAEEQQAVRSTVESLSEPYRSDGGPSFPSRRIFVRAR